ncbi:PhoH family protein [Parvibaculum sp.]|jgi:phosphate starvation-inducible PhoH-like protein|uniref:PhoH family protein n=1 Tax=Parvibaculum sp. TaxID=2024848 RepID=UPI000C941410|nr:PhoH family protein [Parvibaculum sp.]MAB15521.1 phosphate starvation-inducible protein PhoH [Parvibaculum sp.]
MTSVSSASGGGESLVLAFDDNSLLTELFGANDRHLARIEQGLDIVATSRGNKLVITGTAEARDQAGRVFKDLYARLKSGQDVNAGEVDGAIRMAQSSNVEAAAEAREPGGRLQVVTKRRTITPRSQTQAAYIDALFNNELVFGVGPAGTGKTYLAVAVAVSMLLQKRVDRIILSRPAVEAGERLGFLPGDLKEKIDPYLRPLYDALYDTLPGVEAMKGIESGEIEVAPLAFMRGRTLANSYVILDEAQNCTPVQMKMFLTRLGENSRMAITGDPSQVDLPLGAKSGLKDALDVLDGVQGTATVRFSDVDVVRHPLVTRIVKAYNFHERGLLDTSNHGNDGPKPGEQGHRKDGK